MTTTSDAMLAAIAADLDDDTRRFAYADWLDENGDSDRAELIRVQCQLAPRRDVIAACGPDLVFTPQIREHSLLTNHPEWTQWPCPVVRDPKEDVLIVGNGRFKYREHALCTCCVGTGNLLNDRRITWDRGWPGWVHVERVSELVTDRGTDEYGYRHTDPTPLLTALTKTPPWGVPLRGVIVEELRPSLSIQFPGWWRFYIDEGFPRVVYDLLIGEHPQDEYGRSIQPYWRTREAAIREESAAFLEFGRKANETRS